ncbi:MAG TPA: tRNA lysidine(34) synthetase TilS [Desulfonatronum sp.]|nr:tRNA lysidine(34) synthetase TilS [Desulfonatronum sp.]
MIAPCPSSFTLPSRLQDLPPAWARFCLRIDRFISQTVGPIHNRHLLLACSAGSDSLALLLVMNSLASRLKIKLSAVHLDHCLRSESRNETLALARVCATLNIPLKIGRSNVGRYARKTGLGIEEAGRTLRYRFLLGLGKKINADLILTAHHADDLAEDVLMRLLRGAGWPGLAGMPAWDPKRRLARPLLRTTKQTLQTFLRVLDLTWQEDASNADQNFLRNRIRSAILPEIKREFPGMHRGIARLHALASLDLDYFTTRLAPLLTKAREHGHFLERRDLAHLHPALRLRLFKALVDDLGPGQARHDALLRLEQAWQENRTGACIQFPGEKTGTVTAQGIRFAVSRAAQRGAKPCA